MGWLITLGVITLLAILPLGVSARYDASGGVLLLLFGPLKWQLLPGKKDKGKNKSKGEPEQQTDHTKKKKNKVSRKTPQKKGEPAEKTPESANPDSAEKPAETKEADANQKNEEKGGSWTDFLPLVQVVLDLLNDFRRKLRVNRLDLKLVMAGDDPYDLAVNYGRAWAALGNLITQLEKVFVIQKRNLDVACDFTATGTLVTARLDLTITLGRALAIVVVYGIRSLREYLKIRNKRKGGASK